MVLPSWDSQQRGEGPNMARILRFPAQKSVTTAAPPNGPARIIIFPGVRYERLDDSRTPNSPRRKSRRKA